MRAAGGYQTLRVAEERETLRVVLDRPERNNSINDVMLHELHAAVDRAEQDPGVRSLVLEGTGRVFCSGMDLTEAAESPSQADAVARGGRAFFRLLRRFTTSPCVVVARVDGRVTGGGVGLVAASDFVYATERSSFGLPEALWGLLPCSVLPFLIRRVGFQPAYAMTLSTLPVDAREAERIRLVDEVVEDTGVALRRLTARLRLLDVASIADAKRYLGRMGFQAAEFEDIAMAEFCRLMSSTRVRDSMESLANQRLPWES